MLTMPARAGAVHRRGHQLGHRRHQHGVAVILFHLLVGGVVGLVLDAVLLRERPGDLVQRRQAVVVHVARVHRDPRHALADVADDVHHAHGAAGADDVDDLVVADLAGLGDVLHRIGRVRAGGADDADPAVMHPADHRDHGRAEPLAAQDDVQQAVGRDLREQLLRRAGVGAEVDHVVIRRVLEIEDAFDQNDRRPQVGRRDRLGDPRHFGGRAVPLVETVHPAVGDRRVGDDQHPAAGLERRALLRDIGVLDARPGLAQGDGRGGSLLAGRDQHRLAVGGGDDPLVHQDVFLQGALEVVAEGGVGGRRLHPAIIGLDEVSLAGLVPRDAGPDRDDPHDRLMAGDRGRRVRHIARDLLEDVEDRRRRRPGLCGRGR